LPRRGLYRRALPDGGVRRGGDGGGAAAGCPSLLPGRLHAAPAPRRGRARRARRGRRRRDARAARGDAGAHRARLAQLLEVPRAHLPPPVLGWRDDAGQRAGHGRRPRPGAAPLHRLRRRGGAPTARDRRRARGRAGRALGETIQRRGSTRSFAQTPLGVAELGAALWATSRPVQGDVPTGLVDIYMSAHAVEGLPPGTYLYRRDAHALDPLDTGEFRRQAAFLCLEQPLGGDAAATLFFLSPLDAVLAAFGERGYRLVN